MANVATVDMEEGDIKESETTSSDIGNSRLLQEYEAFSAMINTMSESQTNPNGDETSDEDSPSNGSGQSDSPEQHVVSNSDKEIEGSEQKHEKIGAAHNENLVENSDATKSTKVPHDSRSESRSSSRSRHSKRKRSRSRKHHSSSSKRHHTSSRRRKSSSDRHRKSSSSYRHKKSRSRSRSRSRNHYSSSKGNRSRDRSRSSRDRKRRRDSPRKRSRSPQKKNKSPFHRPSPVRTYPTNRKGRRQTPTRQTSSNINDRQTRMYAIQSQAEEERKKLQDETMKKLKDMAANGTLDLTQISLQDLMKTIDVPKEYRKNQQTIMSYQMEQVRKNIAELTGIQIPNFYSAGTINPLVYAEQQRKRKLLWSKAKENENTATSKVGAAMTEGQDEKTAEKFRKLMGLKSDDSVQSTTSSDTNAIKQMQQRTFDSLDKEYQVARVATHIHKGVGLGFFSQGPIVTPSTSTSTQEKN
ncbi:unnamed protein product [Didymodactylos carnosus]|uniref:Small acidic protein-like domain-containing protein n=1 Tax=Didymodactylos carnosus TaxID=1234261 RepID=A0A813QF65_9BILA|nr:unnamed protein product [Didymodactylos carnosus]CAF1069521.1 unnamed protein product [Didymodactylos carnosus]CAF3547624.1 unnamed protein product [Didymodactylos carnosus]CAF3834056.1 unnamed protein product [Didymodactylos carnosus]